MVAEITGILVVLPRAMHTPLISIELRIPGAGVLKGSLGKGGFHVTSSPPCWWTVNKRSLISSFCLSTSICSFHHCYLCLPRLHELSPSNPHPPPPPRGESHMKRAGMLVVLLRGVNFRLWSRLGCSGQNTIIFSRKGVF